MWSQSRLSISTFEKPRLDYRDNLDSSKNDVSTVEIFSTVWKMTSRQISTKCMPLSLDFWQGLDRESRSWHVFKVSLNILKKDISTCRDISISIVETPRLKFSSSNIYLWLKYDIIDKTIFKVHNTLLLKKEVRIKEVNYFGSDELIIVGITL